MNYYDHDLQSEQDKIIIYATEEKTIYRAEVEVKKFLESEAESNAWLLDPEQLLISVPALGAEYDSERDEFYVKTLYINTLNWDQFQKYFKQELTQKIEMFCFLYDTELDWEKTDMKPEPTADEEAEKAWRETRL